MTDDAAAFFGLDPQGDPLGASLSRFNEASEARKAIIASDRHEAALDAASRLRRDPFDALRLNPRDANPDRVGWDPFGAAGGWDRLSPQGWRPAERPPRT